MDGKVFEKLTILGEGAKYDVSCSSSGTDRTNIGRLGNAACAGICHTWTADGRCMSLLKVLLSNDCAYDCKYCVNRRSADVKRCTFEPRELADITMEFYRRNYIEGLFLSSAVLRTPDNTVERMGECLAILREEYGFAGYIHAKVIPGVSPEILTLLGLVSDRLSVNIELPSSESLSILAPQKKAQAIFSPMRQIMQTQIEQKTLKAPGFRDRLLGREGGAVPAEANTNSIVPGGRRNYKERFAPAGQTTQMIIGASPETDKQIIGISEQLYRRFSLKRVYFSAYIPVASKPELPSLLTPPPLKREHRLYQADWLLRFYGFTADEIFTDSEPNLDTDLDPKVIWALRNLEHFPIEINRASEEELLRIPGIGNTSVFRILRQRRIASVDYDDLKKMGVVLKRARYFMTCSGKYFGDVPFEPAAIRTALGGGIKPQISLFETLGATPVVGSGMTPAHGYGSTHALIGDAPNTDGNVTNTPRTNNENAASAKGVIPTPLEKEIPASGTETYSAQGNTANSNFASKAAPTTGNAAKTAAWKRGDSNTKKGCRQCPGNRCRQCTRRRA